MKRAIPEAPDAEFLADLGDAAEVLHASPTTRIERRAGPAPGERIVCKTHLGPHAERRRDDEAAMLAQLEDVDGVARIAPHVALPQGLALRDAGGVTLASLLGRGRCGTDAALRWALQLARILADVHRAGVVHRDVNPSNLLVTAERDMVLIDFDRAVLAHAPAWPAEDGAIEGTLAYVAPEQTGRTGRAVDHRCDLYAFGVTLYEMATGRLPFEGGDALTLIRDHLVREPRPPAELDPAIPQALSDIILRLLAKSPEHRYQSAEGAMHDLARVRDALARGHAPRLALGERDFPKRLATSHLVGRNAERAVLREAYARALRSAHRTVLVEGAAGVGKTSLIQELRPLVTQAGGWFVQGKFDQAQRDAGGEGAFTQAVRAVGHLLLALPADELAAQRTRLLERLGTGAALMTRLSPELALLLGRQPEAALAEPRQAQLQLLQATVDFFGTVASAHRPLVVAVDDLQWAGADALRAFDRCLEEPQPRGLMLVGAYRGDQVAPGAPLAEMLARWREHRNAPAEIALAPLGAADLGDLVTRVLRLPDGPAQELAEALHGSTGGNPFDTVELLNALRSDGALSLGAAGWQWDDASVRTFVGQGNVVDLLAARIARLPAASREVVDAMGCIGNAMPTALLRAALGVDAAELAARLRAPQADGLLAADEAAGADRVKFRHDRVQQAVAQTMEPGRRARLQLAMARRFAGTTGMRAAAAQQYLNCHELVLASCPPEEQRLAARASHDIAAQWIGKANFDLAERHLAAASALMAVAGDHGMRRERAAIEAKRHASLYSLGRLDEADRCFAALQELLAHGADGTAASDDPGADGAFDDIEPTCLQMRSLDMRGRMRDAMALGRLGLGRLGVVIPEQFDSGEVERRLDALELWVAQETGLDHRRRAPLHDRRLRATARLLDRTMRAAYVQFDIPAHAWLALESQRLWTLHGPCPEMLPNLGMLSGLLILLRRNWRAAYAVARHVMVVGEALDAEPQSSEARWMFGAYSSHWFDTLEEAQALCRRAIASVKASGNPTIASTMQRALVFTLIDTSPTIESCLAEIDECLALCRRIGNNAFAALHTTERQWLRALAGATHSLDDFDDDGFDEADFLSRFGDLPWLRHTHATRRALHALLVGDANGLARHAAFAAERLDTLPGYYLSAHVHLCRALAAAWRLQASHRADADALRAELVHCRGWLADRARDQPHNFLHLLRLAEAEEAWALGQEWEASRAFDAAIGECDARRRPWHLALIVERAACFHLARGLPQTGRLLLARAREHYRAWGAHGKVARMEEEHPFLRLLADPSALDSPGRSNTAVSPRALDLLGVLRASQALSSETRLAPLNAKVTEVLAALTGATSVRVLLCADGEWALAPTDDGPPTPLAQAARDDLLPMSAFAYAERTGEPLLVDSARDDDRFARDPYFGTAGDCSLLLVPIAGQGSARAMLYLENRAGRAAFNAQGLDAVKLIAGQLAVSLANAQLYASMEQRVQARTHELREAQSQLVASARQAGKAEIANNVLHNVGNVLNSVTVSATLAGRTVAQSRIGRVAQALDLMMEHTGRLDEFMSRDPRGQGLSDYLRKLSTALVAEQGTVSAELDRLMRSVSHIRDIVATQQSIAGASTVREPARPDELVEEALHVSEAALARGQVALVREYEATHPLPLDRPRILQVLVNLIGNAAQAMESVDADRRRLTLATRVVEASDAPCLHIAVRDAGEGIAAENLARIFSHGFTTRKSGHGFGLHGSALAAIEMGGKLTAHSDGPGLGAVFTLELPLRQ